MSYAICIVPVAPLRTSPDHRAEMSSQVLFGEQVKVISVDEEGWAQVQCCLDNYMGCCRLNQFILLEQQLVNTNDYSGDWVQPITVNNEQLMIPLGADLSLLKGDIKNHQFDYKGKIINAGAEEFSETKILAFSRPYLNTAYLWGGRSVFGIDCSGFAQAVFKMMNVHVARDANQQVLQGEAIGFLMEAKCGDLAFFDDQDGKIIHVGILLNEQRIIHASGNVRIDAIDSEGIIHSGTRKRTHRLRVIKRVRIAIN